MRRLQNQMLRIPQHRLLHLGRTAPEDKHHRAVDLIQYPDRRIRERLPADAVMAVCLMCPHGQHGVQHQHALIRPLFKIPVIRNRAAEVVMQLLIDVHEGWRDGHLRLHRKAEPMGLSRLVVRILSEDHHLHLFQRSEGKSIENILCRRIDRLRFIFLIDGMIQLFIVRLAEFRLQRLQPVIRNHHFFLLCILSCILSPTD